MFLPGPGPLVLLPSWELQIPSTVEADIPLDPAAAIATAALALTAPTQVPLGTSAAQSSATLALIADAYYSAVMGTSGLTSYWRLDESAGTNAADTFDSNPGTYTAGYTLGAVGALASSSDTAVSLNGTSGWISLPSSIPTYSGTDVTFECWMRTSDTTKNDQQLYGGYQNGGAFAGWGVMYNLAGSHKIGYYSSSLGSWVESTGTITDTLWHHIAVTVSSAGAVTFYIDGSATGTPSSAAPGNWTGTKGIGATQDGLVNFFKGDLDEVALYGGVLSGATVLSHYQIGSGTTSGPAIIPLATSAAVSTATLALSAQTQVPLGTSAAVSTATLALSAQTKVALGTSAAVSTATLALTAPTKVTLQASAAQSAATLSLNAPTQIPFQSSAATSTTSLAVTATTRVALGTSAAQSSATLALTAQTQIPLQASTATSSAALTVTAGPGVVPLQPSAATSSATLALTAKTTILLETATAVSTASLTVSTPTQTFIPLDPAVSTSTGTLALRAPTRVTLQASAAASTASLAVFTPTAALLTLGAANATSTASLVMVQMGRRWPAHIGTHWDVDPQTRWPATTEGHWAPAAAGNHWNVDPQTHW